MSARNVRQDKIVAPDAGDEKIIGLPIDRFVAFIGPYIAVAGGAVANWLLVHIHLLGTFHLTSNGFGKDITQVLVFGITAILIWLGHQKWLEGRHILMSQGYR